MTISNTIPADAVLVAIDIAKVRNEVLIEAPGDKRRRRLQVLNNRAEHDRLIEILQSYGRPVVCGFEATGNYHRPIAWRLAEAGFEVRLVSSLALARTREALHNGWDKNDPKDAQVILHMLKIQATQAYHDPLRAGINDVQELSKTHEAIAIDHFYEGIKKKPETTFGNVNADVLALKDPEHFVRGNFCSIILGSAWPI